MQEREIYSMMDRHLLETRRLQVSIDIKAKALTFFQTLICLMLSIVISCPQNKRYDVYLTQLLSNTTISEIVNEI